jgi:hypothetical protein
MKMLLLVCLILTLSACAYTHEDIQIAWDKMALFDGQEGKPIPHIMYIHEAPKHPNCDDCRLYALYNPSRHLVVLYQDWSWVDLEHELWHALGHDLGEEPCEMSAYPPFNQGLGEIWKEAY